MKAAIERAVLGAVCSSPHGGPRLQDLAIDRRQGGSVPMKPSRSRGRSTAPPSRAVCKQGPQAKKDQHVA